MSELFSSILIPGFFLLACILQLHYFHQPFMQLTDLEHVPPPSDYHPRWAHRCACPLRVAHLPPQPLRVVGSALSSWEGEGKAWRFAEYHPTSNWYREGPRLGGDRKLE